MFSIMVVDDNHDACNALARLFGALGHHGIAVYSGEDALAKLNGTIDLILLDNMMPGMDGIEVLRQIREERKLTLPVVMFSAISDLAFQEHARRKGATDYWVKASLNYDDLEMFVNRLLPPVAVTDNP